MYFQDILRFRIISSSNIPTRSFTRIGKHSYVYKVKKKINIGNIQKVRHSGRVLPGWRKKLQKVS